MTGWFNHFCNTSSFQTVEHYLLLLVQIMIQSTTHRPWATLTLQATTPQNGQTPLNNLSALPTNCLSVFDHFAGLTLNGLTSVNCIPSASYFETCSENHALYLLEIKDLADFISVASSGWCLVVWLRGPITIWQNCFLLSSMIRTDVLPFDSPVIPVPVITPWSFARNLVSKILDLSFLCIAMSFLSSLALCLPLLTDVRTKVYFEYFRYTFVQSSFALWSTV